MCGIAGAFLLDPEQEISVCVVQNMVASLHHRGPDDSGFFATKRVALGHCRLSIIDPSPEANQPLLSRCKRFVIVYNGEIYNFLAIRRELEDAGSEFVTRSDTEVLLKLFEKFGLACVDHLEGMFAFAVVDLKEQYLYLCRDRVGEKPLFYAVSDGVFYFASEIKSFWRVPSISKAISPDGLIRYFSYTQPPAPYTIFSNIHRIKPAHWLIVDRTGHVMNRPYWRVDFTAKWNRKQYLIEELESILHNAINLATIGDWPIGLLLSGGVDSSLILALLKITGSKDLHCFTIASSQAAKHDYDLDLATKQAQAAKVAHSIFPFTSTRFEDVKEAFGSLDEPIGIYDVVMSLFHSRHIKRHRRVVLTGSGADEIFGGYESYLSLATPSPGIHSARSNCSHSRLVSQIAHHYASIARVDSENLWGYRLKAVSTDIDWTRDFDWLCDIAQFDTRLDAKLISELYVSMSHCTSMFDTVGMASSVEFRSPYFNHKVIEFAARLPTDLKVTLQAHKYWRTKPLLKYLGYRYVPEAIIVREKTGYSASFNPAAAISGPWRKEIDDTLIRNEDLLAPLVDTKKARYFLETFRQNNTSILEKRRLQKLVIFLAWFEAQSFSSV